MTIHCNKNITKQLNSYSYEITITLHDLLQCTKRALRVLQVWHKLNDWIFNRKDLHVARTCMVRVMLPIQRFYNIFITLSKC